MSGPAGGGTRIDAQLPFSTHFGKFSVWATLFFSLPEVFFAILFPAPIGVLFMTFARAEAAGGEVPEHP
jgi:hypothetical protein